MATFKNLTNAEIVPRAVARDDAETTTGNMSTLRVVSTYFAHHKGSMPSAWHRLYAERVRAALIDHVIYSYSTPIAWLDREHGWIIPAVTYSATTSTKHQSQLYRLGGRRIEAPWDATPEDMRRVLSGELVFVYKGYGQNRVFTGTIPGPNYIGE